MELNGIHPDVIAAVTNLWRHPNFPKQRWVRLMGVPVNEREALFVVGYLLGRLSAENTGNIPLTTGLLLKYDADDAVFSAEAVAVFCDFLRHTPHLSVLTLRGFPPAFLRQLLEALHTNMSVKELRFGNIHNEECVPFISELLLHKTDLRRLGFRCCRAGVGRVQHNILQHGQPNLQQLAMRCCGLDDEMTRSLVQTLVDNKDQFKNLKALDLSANHMTSTGLRSLCQLGPDVLPSLDYLNLSQNPTLLDDENITGVFVRRFLLSPRAKLDKLHLRRCSTHASVAGYIAVIKALATNKTLTFLNILGIGQEFHESIKDELIRSIPKMTRLQHLLAEEPCFDLDDPRMIPAVRQNVSLLELARSHDELDPRLLQIFVRNVQMAKLDVMLGRATTTSTSDSSQNASTIPPRPLPRSLWSRVLANVGRFAEGGSPVFKILRDRLPAWSSEMSTSNGTKRKQEHGQENSNTKKYSKQG